jgi:drug/metabolite transporter (DMT)-like permease
MKTALVLTLAILAQAAGATLLSKEMRQLASFDRSFLSALLQALADPAVWLGTALLIAFFLLYAASLSWADLSFVLPATSFGYVVNVAFAHYFLSEPISGLRWVGTLLISVGVIVVSRSGTRRTRTRNDDKVFACAGENNN